MFATVLAVAASASSTGPRPAAAAPASAGPDSLQADTAGMDWALFAGGPYWALEAAFESQPGVRAAVNGFTGGEDTNVDYGKVIEGGTGHCLAVEVRFDPKRIRYATLVEVFWRQIDPLAYHRQFSDSGPQFRTAIFYRDPAQKRIAEATLHKLQRSGRFRQPIRTVVEPAARFIPAEESRQDYYRKHPGRYRAWAKFSGRAEALETLWGAGKPGKPAKARPHSPKDSP